MSPEVMKFIPVATMLAALVVGFALDPTKARPVWWAIPVGLVVGFAIQFGVRRYYDARR